ncbi:hypothetical protein NHH03_24050 [Stieleria sp. TO1_6]|uniref:SMI1/KNR4 family protein n=1 Tax=Stieleria tagensis TaxID=2956795 RepID=UPI00209A8FBD|nr:hypothetical protein [Stieleria tagensis]MCO8124832.1 hypothetical protein [Stieleria tagensis]
MTPSETNHRFTAAISPQELLSNAPAAIWPALMPCDFLPILGNQMGDWLCLRFRADNSASQIVHWYHGGGDWIPWGDSLAEAILFDSFRQRLPGSIRDHAIPAIDDASNATGDPAEGPLDTWALEQLQRDSVTPTDAERLQTLSGHELAEALIQRHLCLPAVRCHLVIDALANPLISDEILDAWSATENDQVQRSLLDNQLMTESQIALVQQLTGLTSEQILAQQDWDSVHSQCRQVTRQTPLLAWAWDLLGYSLERSDDVPAAIDAYRHGLRCSIFTDQTVRVRTHGFNGDGQKFSAARLIQLAYQSSDPDEQTYLNALSCPNADERREQVRSHFAALAAKADPATAHDLWFRAGWDLGAEPMIAFAELLDQVTVTSKTAGRVAQSELAQTHRNCFRDRYGI